MGQGGRGLAANGLMSIASISIVAASIAIFGIFILLGINMNYISEQVEYQVEIFVEVERYADVYTVQNIGAQIEQIEGVRAVVPLSAQAQLEQALIDNADDPRIVGRLERSNPFLEAFQVFLNDPIYAADVERQISEIYRVYEIDNDPGFVQWIMDFARTLRTASVWIIIILALVAIFIISNTIKLGMFARRREINIMKYVGATNWFIRWPFVFEGMFVGLIGGVISAGIMLWGYNAMIPGFNDWIGGIVDMASIADVWQTVLFAHLLLGGGIGIVGSALSIRKYLFV